MLQLKKAFTLLEILVVIGIIGIMVAMGTASYSTAQKKARDAKRKTDLRTIQNALEQYYSVCNYLYPTPAPASPGLVNEVFCPNPSIGILQSADTPIDPKSKTKYNMTDGGDTYLICAPTISATMGLETEAAAYCLKNQQ